MENIWKLEIEHKVGTGRRCGGPKTTDRGPFRICAVERLSVSCDASPIPKHNQHIFKKGNWFVISLLARFSAELSIYYLELYVCIIPLYLLYEIIFIWTQSIISCEGKHGATRCWCQCSVFRMASSSKEGDDQNFDKFYQELRKVWRSKSY